MSGYYGATSTDITAAVKVVLVAVDGGFNIKFELNGATKYINTEVSGTHLNFVIRDTASSVWAWNSELNTLTTACGSETVFMGTYGTYVTFGVSAISKAETSYVAHLTEVEGTVTPEPTPDPEPTPTPTPDPNPGETTSAEVVIEDYASANSWSNGVLYDTITVDANTTITVAASTPSSYGQNTGKYYTSDQSWRLYQADTTTLTVTSTKTIVSIQISYISNKTGSLTFDGANIETDTVVSVNGTTATFGVGNTGSATNGQARVTKITIVYAD